MKINGWAVFTVFLPLMMLGALTAEPEKAVDAPPHKVEPKSPLIGKWVNVLCIGNGNIPTIVHVVTIGEDGIFHSVDVHLLPGKEQNADGAPIKPAGAELADYETGKINLETGAQALTKEAKEMSVKSVSWSVVDGQLNWCQDMGDMGTSNLSYSRAGDL